MIRSHLAFSAGTRSVTAHPMPHIPELQDVYALGWTPRQGEVIMVVGQPGAQKSGFAMFLSSRWGLPTLYFCADMGDYVASERDACIRSGLLSTEVREIRKQGGEPLRQLEDQLAGSNFHFVSNPEPSLDDIDDAIDSFVEMYNAYPPVIVIDNLMDVAPINENEHASTKALVLEFKKLARRTQSVVMVIHHNREEGDPTLPSATDKIAGRLSQTAETIVAVALDQTIFRVAIVKQRQGKADKTGKTYAELIADPPRTAFRPKSFYESSFNASHQTYEQPPLAVAGWGQQ